MASDAIVNELWEITNRNSDKKIEREEFEEELRASVFAKLKEMSPDNSINNINDEYARALPVILHQAEVNPDSLGQIQGGKFTIGSKIIMLLYTKNISIKFILNRYVFYMYKYLINYFSAGSGPSAFFILVSYPLYHSANLGSLGESVGSRVEIRAVLVFAIKGLIILSASPR